MLSLYASILMKVSVSSKSFLVESSRPVMIELCLRQIKIPCIFLSCLHLVICFLCLNALAKISGTVLKKTRVREYLCHVPDYSGNAAMFPHLV